MLGYFKEAFDKGNLLVLYSLITFYFLSTSHYDSRFSELLEMSNESTIHIKNIEVLTTETIKLLNDLSPPIMNEIFQNHYYSLRKPGL